MTLQFRLAQAGDFDRIEKLILGSFEPITWMKKADERYGPLNGHDWPQRWRYRVEEAFAHQTVLVGEADSEVAAVATGSLDARTLQGWIELLAVDQKFQGLGYGREMLHGMVEHFRSLGAKYISLECLADNDTGNALYQSEGFEEVARSVRWFKKL
jgi:ribosomal protein S18 acetylase RimI-like enzyme